MASFDRAAVLFENCEKHARNRPLTPGHGARWWRWKEGAVLKKGMRVVEPTKKVGHVPRRGKVVEVDGRTVGVQWDDGHVSHLTDAVLIPEDSASTATSNN